MKSYEIKNIDCASCAAKIEDHLKKNKIVDHVSINLASSRIFVDTEDIEEVKKAIRNVEPDVELISGEKKEEDKNKGKMELIRIGISIFLLIAGLLIRNYLSVPAGSALILASYLSAGWKVIFTAGKKIINKDYFDEHFLMSIATAGAIAVNQFEEAAAVMIFYSAGLYLESVALNKSRKSIKALLEVAPSSANLIDGDKILKVKPEEINPGDIILIRAGEKVPLDGTVIEGESYIDLSPITGEPFPVFVNKNTNVSAGGINRDGVLKLKVMRKYEESSIAKILDLVENASLRKAGTEKFITKFAKIYTPIIVVLAFMIAFLPPLLIENALLSDWVYRALVVLVVSCPCALVISIPLSYFGGIGKASGRGILIKGSSFIDVLADLKKIVFDKTGTLTRGKFSISKVETVNGYSEEEVLRLAALIEHNSMHPVAAAIKSSINDIRDTGLITDIWEVRGKGMHGKFNGESVFAGNRKFLIENNIEVPEENDERVVVYIAAGTELKGKIFLDDTLKSDAADSVKSLRNNGIEEITMLTGDRELNAKNISGELGLDTFYSELLPEEKLGIFEDIKSLTGKTAFVGDGINDSPVIAAADVGIAMGGIGTDAAIEAADVVIMDDSLNKIPEAVIISKKTKKIVFQNISFAIGIKVIFILLGIAGMATMWEAVFGDIGVTLLVIINSLRILK